mmetsp:Transcript_96717/g.282745  ORF Transcript_96717/g.282745 Transcript_96717/m.282745 type:complete len:224 (+) Transcript_96717:1320-1991(+)
MLGGRLICKCQGMRKVIQCKMHLGKHVQHARLASFVAGGMEALESLLCSPPRLCSGPCADLCLDDAVQSVHLPVGIALRVLCGLLRTLGKGQRLLGLALREVEPCQGLELQRLQRLHAQGLEEVESLPRSPDGAVPRISEGVRTCKAVERQSDAPPTPNLAEEVLSIHTRLPYLMASVFQLPALFNVHVDHGKDSTSFHQRITFTSEHILCICSHLQCLYTIR